MDPSLLHIGNVFYPPMGIAHITHNLRDLFDDKIAGKNKITIRSSSQPNSNPHLGTVTTIMVCFALAGYLQDQFGIETEIIYDLLENSPGEKRMNGGLEYQLSLKDCIKDNTSVYELYLPNFLKIFDYSKQKSNIRYRLREYSEFQRLTIVRETVLKILNKRDAFINLVSPSEKNLHIRIGCPKCKLIEKGSRNLIIKEIDENKAILSNSCPDHGPFDVEVTSNNLDFIDINTPLRDILQGVISIENDKIEKSLSIMVDGSDWAGVWALRVFCSGLLLLGYNKIPERIFAPMILDWSGAKFSKSLYLQSNAYNYLPKGFIDFSMFLDTYGERGLDSLWFEIQSWINDTKKLFRNYSIDYLKLILEKNK